MLNLFWPLLSRFHFDSRHSCLVAISPQWKGRAGSPRAEPAGPSCSRPAPLPRRHPTHSAIFKRARVGDPCRAHCIHVEAPSRENMSRAVWHRDAHMRVLSKGGRSRIRSFPARLCRERCSTAKPAWRVPALSAAQVRGCLSPQTKGGSQSS